MAVSVSWSVYLDSISNDTIYTDIVFENRILVKNNIEVNKIWTIPYCYLSY